MKPQSAINEVNLTPGFAKKIPGLEFGKVAKVTVIIEPVVDSTGQKESPPEPNPVWCIVFRSNDPSSMVLKCGGTNDTITVYIPVEKTPLYVTHWEQVGDSMIQLDIIN